MTAIRTQPANKFDLAAHLVLAGLEKFKGKMSAAEQRAAFGAYVFGKKNLTINCDGQGSVHVWASACFGLDSNSADVSFQDICDHVNGVKPVTLGF